MQAVGDVASVLGIKCVNLSLCFFGLGREGELESAAGQGEEPNIPDFWK